MCSLWIDDDVLKLLEKNISYNTMKDCFQRVWKLQCGFEVMVNDDGFYTIKLYQTAYKECVILDAPWMIFDYYLDVFHWSR